MARGLSQKEAADFAGIGNAYLSLIENGVRYAGLKAARALCDALGLGTLEQAVEKGVFIVRTGLDAGAEEEVAT